MVICTPVADCVQTLPAAPGPAAARPVRILLVEDNVEEMLMVKQILQEFGRGRFELEWANCLEQAAEQLGHGFVDLLVLDLGLPECEGPVSCIAVHNWAPSVPIVVLTADDREETEERVMNYGADDYLVKDEVSGLGLIHAIRSALYRKKSRTRSTFPNAW